MERKRPTEKRRGQPTVPSRGAQAEDVGDEPSEFDAFHELASKLVKVPKKELDEARKREADAKT